MAHYKPTIPKICIGCENEFRKPPSHAARIFCSRACMATDRVFLSKINKTATCWLWTGFAKDGYGQWKSRSAHRYSYSIYKGSIPAGLVVMHSCDNRLCVNPDHLSLGTIADNVADAVAKGRMAKGERKPAAKLTERSVIELRRLYGLGNSARALGRQFGVSKTTVMDIINRKFWTHVQ